MPTSEDKGNASEAHMHNDLPPAYSSNEGTTSPDTEVDYGRIAIDLDSKLARTLSKFVKPYQDDLPPPAYSEIPQWSIPLNIVVQVVGSRGDVQPFVALGVELKKYGHRVRLATHGVFKDFVHDAGLEFYPIGGDPAQLMAYMVKNPGLIPSMKTLRSGEISRKRAMIEEMLHGCWNSCIKPDPYDDSPFVANAIIANPPSFAHVHCAEALSIPLHMMFTMPWSPTRKFPHPLANLSGSALDESSAYYVSYLIIQMLTWQGLADVFNDFRAHLHLDALPTGEAPFIIETLQIPYTYCWSPALVPKPQDWPTHYDVTGFIFREPTTYTPPSDLLHFINDGPAPIYVGFGSIVVDNPAALMKTVLLAVRRAGVRAIISKGWSKLASDSLSEIDKVYLIDDCPHEWLFQHVAAVVHHGGAGTTAAGLLNGRPTAIVPFFGDQPFWGEQIAARGAGPAPINHKQLTVERLAHAISFCMTPEARNAANEIAQTMRAENGVAAAADSFHRHLDAKRLQCDILPNEPAIYKVKLDSKNRIKISGPAVEALLKHNKIRERDIAIYRPQKYEFENRRYDPVTSLASSQLGTLYDMVCATNDLWYGPIKAQKREELKTRIDAITKPPSSETSSIASNDLERKRTSYAKMAASSAMAVPTMSGVMLKGSVVDMPHAVTEGLRSLPRLYGEDVAPLHVTGVQSGFVAGGKNFVQAGREGLTDLFVQPYKGAQDNGALGLAAGLGKGVLGTVSKLGSATLGLWAYPAQGTYLSIRHAALNGTRKKVLAARREADRVMSVQGDTQLESVVLAKLEQLS